MELEYYFMAQVLSYMTLCIKLKNLKMIRNLYYKIWVDGITKLRSIPANKGIWKFYAVAFISMAMAFNLALVMVILQKNITNYSFYDFNSHFFEEQKLNYFLKFFVLFLLPPLIMNYFFIFRNKRYEMLISKYKSYNGKLCASYLVISYLLPFFLLIISFLLGY